MRLPNPITLLKNVAAIPVRVFNAAADYYTGFLMLPLHDLFEKAAIIVGLYAASEPTQIAHAFANTNVNFVSKIGQSMQAQTGIQQRVMTGCITLSAVYFTGFAAYTIYDGYSKARQRCCPPDQEGDAFVHFVGPELERRVREAQHRVPQ